MSLMRIEFLTEYPAKSIPGEALSTFVELVEASTDGAINLNVGFEAPQNAINTLALIKTEKIQGAAVFGGSLSALDSAFSLSSLPRKSGALDCAYKDFQSREKIFSDALFQQGLHLLGSVPMPPTGIWSKHRIDNLATFKTMRIRTYDQLSQEVFAELANQALFLPFSQVGAALEAGELEAVLSSGDGAAGVGLARFLTHFSPIAYAVPVTFLVVSHKTMDSLPSTFRKKIKIAGRQTQKEYWENIWNREQQNLRHMEMMGITVNRAIDDDFVSPLLERAKLIRNRTIALVESTVMPIQVCSY